MLSSSSTILYFIGPWEIALVAAIIILLFGGKKIPELARSVGSAIKEYRKASGSSEEEQPEEEMSVKEEQVLVDAAKKLGINTEGKTPEEISEAIMKKTKKS